MRLTKKMENLIDKRTRLAQELMDVSSQVDSFIYENGIESEIEKYDMGTGCEIYVNPAGSGERVKEAIRNHKTR